MKFLRELQEKNWKYGININGENTIDFSSISKEKIEEEEIILKNEKNKIIINLNEKINLKKIKVYLKRNSKDTIINIVQKENSLGILEINIYSEKNTFGNIIQIQNSSKNSKILIKKNFFIKAESKIKSINLVNGKDYIFQNNEFFLEEQNSETEDTILFLIEKNQKFDLNNTSHHLSEKTKSNLKIRGVSLDNSKVIETSLIKINEEAKDSEGYEKHEALILSENSEVNSIPNLEINNNQVKCSHGSTIGQIDQEQIFYLMSRGLNKKQAETKIIEGYFNPILQLIQDKSIKNSLIKNLKIKNEL